MKSPITLSLMSLGAIPRALAKRARRERPMRGRKPESCSNRPVQAALNGDLPKALAGIMPLAFTAARKSERTLAKRLARHSKRHRVDGREPSADRSHIERNGGRLVSQQDCNPFHGGTQIAQAGGRKLACPLKGGQHCCQGCGLPGRRRGGILFGFLGHEILLSGRFGPGPERSREDRR